MKKGLRVFVNVILSFVFLVCVLLLVGVSILTINKNEYGFTEFGDKTLVVINESNTSKKYKVGDLVIIKNKDLVEFDGSDEIFVYEMTSSTNEVVISYSTVVSINKINNKAIVFLENGDELTNDELVVGEVVKSYVGVGKVLSFLQSTLGFILLLVPLILILIYLIITIFNKRTRKKITDEDIVSMTEFSNEINNAEISTIVEATEKEPAMVKSDDFRVGPVIDDRPLEVRTEEKHEELEVIPMEPIILDVKEYANSSDKTSVADEEVLDDLENDSDSDDDIEII